MKYRRLGQAGIQVSELSFGSWVTFGKQIDLHKVIECMSAAHDAGVNFFDTAEVYAHGESERLMGEALRKLGWRRGSYLVSTKLFWGLNDSPNEANTLNRKYLLEGVDASLKRMQLEYVDLLFCHRPDPETPIEETVWAMHDLVSRGRALYWGTSEWSADQIEAAFKVAEREHLRKPVMEQPEYSLFARKRVEEEYEPLFQRRGIGATTWSPLASGLLSGKYLSGVPKGSRFSLPGMEWLAERWLLPEYQDAVKKLQAVAQQIECTLAQLAIAWCTMNPRVSTVITGSTSVAQVRENMGAVEVAERLTPEVLTAVRKIIEKLGH